ncbi:glycosyltransferase family protein [Ruegeria sp. HKCCD7255]|uniref:glycosyltransferase family protein n=1 Tax=Ruegeria sp. HKCCD7255 TaxID=2683004 RepID=UPI001488A03D|nr:glycosyltransferase [Ruegeria sp. HKCCD7255]
MKVMIVVTHLLGTGHLSRALTLGRSFSEAGHEVFVISGGMPAPQFDTNGLSILNLPPLQSDGVNFTRLLDQSGSEVDKTYLTARQTALVQALHSFAPDLLITELYPFGRRVLADEFLALLSTAEGLTRRPVVLSSIRDILAPPSKPAKVEQTNTVLTRFYDGVLVHSDPEVIRLQSSWPVSPELACKLHYTGFVAPVPAELHPDRVGAGEIVVSAGGGAVGQPIFRAAIEAARKMTIRRWRLLVGGTDGAERRTELSGLAQGAPVIVEPLRPDFRHMLNHAAASVSMCGYNTAMDLLQSGCPAVVVPFDAGNEAEQSLRAQNLSQLDAFEVIPSTQLNGDTLAAALDRVITQGSRPVTAQGFDGARRTVEIATTLVEARR